MRSKPRNPCCCPGNASCCGPKRDQDKARGSAAEKRRLEIDFLYLDLDVCTRCQSAESSLDDALAEAAKILAAAGIEVAVRKIHIRDEELARAHRLLSSPTIRINGRDIQLDVRESRCESCGDLCGDGVDCRVWIYQGKEYTSPPKAMIVDAILRAVYGRQDEGDGDRTAEYEMPENLRRFFAAMRKKNAPQPG